MSALFASNAEAAQNTGRSDDKTTRTFLELKTWRLHNSEEDQAKRVSEFLDSGLFPALTRAGAKPVAALSNLIGPDGPYMFTIVQYPSLAAMQDALAKIASDETYEKASQKLSSGPGMPFVGLESSVLHSLDVLPEAVLSNGSGNGHARIFELRTYQSQSMTALKKKAGMFNGGEIATFQRLNMQPVFIGETIIGPRQPSITYMLSFENLDGREKLWQQFGSDSEWKKLSAPAELKDSEIVANISNVILRPMPFSPLR